MSRSAPRSIRARPRTGVHGRRTRSGRSEPRTRSMRLAGRHAHPSEPLQFEHGAGDAGHGISDVELDHLVAIALAGVGHSGGYFDGSTAFVIGRSHCRQFEGGVTQPVTEHIERTGQSIDIVAFPMGSPAGDFAAVEHRDLAGGSGMGDGQLPAGVDSPLRTSTIAPAPSSPGSHAASTAAPLVGIGAAIGRPVTSTRTTGVPVATTARTNSSCTPGRSSDMRSLPSPLVQSSVSPALSPMTMIAISLGASVIASSKPSRDVPSRRNLGRRRQSRGRATAPRRPCGPFRPTTSPLSRRLVSGRRSRLVCISSRASMWAG